MDHVSFPYRASAHLSVLHVIAESGSWEKYGVEVEYDRHISSTESHSSITSGVSIPDTLHAPSGRHTAAGAITLSRRAQSPPQHKIPSSKAESSAQQTPNQRAAANPAQGSLAENGARSGAQPSGVTASLTGPLRLKR